MIRFFSPVLSAMASLPFCPDRLRPDGKQLMGDPQNPYPLPSPPRIGQIVHLPTGAHRQRRADVHPGRRRAYRLLR